MRLALTTLATLILAGCASLDGLTLDNRVTCTVAKDKAFVVSEWGSVGISSVISPKDAEVICK